MASYRRTISLDHGEDHDLITWLERLSKDGHASLEVRKALRAYLNRDHTVYDLVDRVSAVEKAVDSLHRKLTIVLNLLQDGISVTTIESNTNDTDVDVLEAAESNLDAMLGAFGA